MYIYIYIYVYIYIYIYTATDTHASRLCHLNVQVLKDVEIIFSHPEGAAL